MVIVNRHEGPPKADSVHHRRILPPPHLPASNQYAPKGRRPGVPTRLMSFMNRLGVGVGLGLGSGLGSGLGLGLACGLRRLVLVVDAGEALLKCVLG